MITKKKAVAVMSALALIVTLGVITHAVDAQAKKPKTVILEGKLVDLTCAAKGQRLMDSDYNALNDTHKTPEGPKQACATACLRGGQPAGIFNDGEVKAVLLANAAGNLYKWAVKDVEVQGWWAGNDKDDVRSFVPQKIRLQGQDEWTEVQTQAMHDDN